MAKESAGGLQFDDFIDRVHADPGKPEPRKLISGFVGRGATDDSIRVYADPSLSQWIEALAADVVHSEPIADSALGGSHLWLTDTAELKPGSTTAAAPAAAPVGGLGADTGVFNPFLTIHPTIWTQLGTCNNHTLGFTCTYVACPPINTAATLCTQVGVCGTAPTHAIGCPNTVSCPPPHPTLATLCTHVGVCGTAPTHGLGCPNTVTCTPTHAMGCPATATCPPVTAGVGCPNTVTCTPTHALGCPATVTCPPATGGIGCPGTVSCPPNQIQPELQAAAVAPTLPIGCPSTSTCTPTYAYGCPSTSTCPPHAGAMPPTMGFACLPTLPQHCLPMTLPHVC